MSQSRSRRSFVMFRRTSAETLQTEFTRRVSAIIRLSRGQRISELDRRF